MADGGAGLPVPPSLTLPPSAGERAVRDAVAILDADRRLGCARRPLFLAAACGSERISHLGLTRLARQWLAGVAGPDYAASCEAALREALLSGCHDRRLPDDGAAQVVLAARALAARSPGQPLRIGVTPLGFGPASGSGLAHSRDPVTGSPGAAGVFLAGGSGAQLLVTPGTPIGSLRPARWIDELRVVLATEDLQAGYPVTAEFVVEDGRLWIISVRQAELRGAALVLAAAASTAAGLTAPAIALLSVPPGELAIALAPHAQVTGRQPAAHGVGVAPGISGGVVVLSTAAAVAARAAGQRPVLVLDESHPGDLDGLMSAVAVVTGLGGYTSHAALITRGIGVPCVAGLQDARVERGTGLLLADGTVIAAGDEITVDGGSGLIYLGGTGAGSGRPDAAEGVAAGVSGAAAALLSRSARFGCVAVRVNADSAADARRGIEAGATGVGLCRIEHMLLGSRPPLVGRLLTEPPGPDRTQALSELRELLRAALAELLIAADGQPVAIRLLDPPRHEFAPAAAGAHVTERNPLLGVRGVRLNLLMADLAAAQIDALLGAVAAARQAGARPLPELLVPMVCAVSEVDAVRRLVADARRQHRHLAGQVRLPVGAMIETPRAALLGGQLAASCDFLCVGTNDLTALTWGLSRDDAEAQLLPRYRDLGIVAGSPFADFDEAGVGGLLRQAVSAARSAVPGLPVGVCGEHAACDAAVSFFAGIGVDYVSCSPPLVPVARLACARAAITWEARQ